jgi:hypothetical protein
VRTVILGALQFWEKSCPRTLSSDTEKPPPEPPLLGRCDPGGRARCSEQSVPALVCTRRSEATRKGRRTFACTPALIVSHGVRGKPKCVVAHTQAALRAQEIVRLRLRDTDERQPISFKIAVVTEIRKKMPLGAVVPA